MQARWRVSQAKRMLLERPKRLVQAQRLVDQLLGIISVFEERPEQPP